MHSEVRDEVNGVYGGVSDESSEVIVVRIVKWEMKCVKLEVK